VSEAMQVPFVDLIRQQAELKEGLLAEFETALNHAAFINGEAVSDFEEQFAQYLGVSSVVGVSNGTDALKLALLATGVGPGDVVVTVPNTFVATVEAIRQIGAHVVFVDVDPATALMDLNVLEAWLEQHPGKAKAILPVHLYGQCVPAKHLQAIAEQHQCLLVEDAAQAHGAANEDIKAGAMGDAAAFSFYPGKNLGACGDAGAVAVRDPEVAQRVRSLADHGQGRNSGTLLAAQTCAAGRLEYGASKSRRMV